MRKSLTHKSRFETLESRSLLSVCIGVPPVPKVLLIKLPTPPVPAMTSVAKPAILAASVIAPPVPVFTAPAPATMLQVTTLAVPTLDILPGTTGQDIAEWNISISSGHNYGRLTSALFVAAGSSLLSQTANSYTLFADLDGNVQNGCETQIGYGNVDYATDLLTVQVNRVTWVRPGQPLHLELKANFNGWLNDNNFGVELASASFNDLSNKVVPDSNVSYGGVAPVVHTLENASFQVSQQTMLPFGSANLGDKDVKLLSYNVYANASAGDTVSFVASQGSLQYATNYVLRGDTNYDGVLDTTVHGTVSGSTLTFGLSGDDAKGGNYEVHCDLTSSLPSGSKSNVLQLAFPADGSGLTAHNATTGKPLHGLQVNGMGLGQIQLYEQTSSATVYNIVTAPAELTVSEGTPNNRWVMATAGQDMLVDSMRFKSTVNMTVTHLAACSVYGTNLSAASNYVLWVDSNGDGKMDTNLGTGHLVDTDNSNQVWFDNISLALTANQPLFGEIHATAPNPLNNQSLQVQLQGLVGIPAGITAKHSDDSLVATDKIFLTGAWQTNWWLSANDGRG